MTQTQTQALTDSLIRLRAAEHRMEVDLRHLEERLDALGDDIAAARLQIAAQQRREHFGHAPEPFAARRGPRRSRVSRRRPARPASRLALAR